MAEVVSLTEAIAELIHDGDAVALEGFTHLIPMAAGHEIIRQGRRDLTLIRMTPDLIYDQMIGAGCARRLVFSWGGNPGVGSLHRFRDAVENQWPHALELEEHTHAGMANRYVAGASRLPFAVVRGYAGSDHIHHGAPNVSTVTCPFTGEVLTAVAALRPDVTIAHAQRADRQGNVQLWGIAGIQREALLAAERTLVTVEEIVDTLEPRPGASIIPGWVLSYVCEVPGEPFRRTRWATTPETTTTTSSGTRSHDTETRSCSGSTPTCSTCKGPPDECLSPVPAARGS
jgi:glutaconate CoA-transferase subunit A